MKHPDLTCCHCNKTFSDTKYFYKTKGDIFIGSGYLPVCRECIIEIYKKYAKKYKDGRKAMKRICMAFDIYYNDAAYDISNTDSDTVIGNYFRRMNMTQFRGKTFDTALEEGFEFNPVTVKAPEEEKEKVEKSKKNKIDEPIEINPEDIEKWGYGLELGEYELLNDHYKYLKNSNPNCDSNQEIFIMELCLTKMQQMKAVRERRVDDYNKLTESYRKSFQQAGLKTTQETTKSADDSWSQWTAIVSQYTPEEYYKDKTLYKDFDGIGEYYERNAIRPLRNLELGTNDRDPEYFIPESEDDSDG